MDRLILKNETWEEYVFRKDLYKVVYEPGPGNIIKNGYIPSENSYAMNELYLLRDKYKMYRYDNHDPKKFTKEDIIYHDWLISRKSICDKNRLELFRVQRKMDDNRYKELVTIISETHKEHLDELIQLISKVGLEYIDEKRHNEKYQKIIDKNIELYNKYMKNKELVVQIKELEIKLNELKSKLIV